MRLTDYKYFKVIGAVLILGWMALCAYLFFLGYWLIGGFVVFVIYDAFQDFLDHYELELRILNVERNRKK